MKNFTWKNNKITHMHIELSSYCNAACPFCPRYVGASSKLRPDLVLDSISFTNFKNWFPKDIIENMQRIIFCGTHGDPMMCKDIIPILKYILTINPGCSIMFNTNGGVRNPEFWKELGNLLVKNNKHNHVTFSIDGLEDTNHLYRRNVNWNKLIANVKAYNSTGAKSVWDFLIFRHNEHQIKQARKLAKKLKFSQIKFKRALGFEHGNNGVIPREVYDKNGNLEYLIESPINKKLINSEAMHRIPKRILRHMDLSFVDSNKPGYNEQVEYGIEHFDVNDTQDENLDRFESSEVVCKSCYGDDKTSEIYVSANGIVFPCCYVGTSFDSGHSDFESNQVRVAMRNFGLDRFNLNKTKIHEIIDNGYLDTIFTSTWNKEKFKDGKMAKCARTCGKLSHIDKIYL